MTPDPASQWVIHLKVERLLQEVVHVQGPCGERPWDCRQPVVLTVLAFTLDFGAVDGCTGRRGVPVHLRLHVVAFTGLNLDGVHLLGLAKASIGALLTAHSG